eukprot:TCONS_00012514-protein
MGDIKRNLVVAFVDFLKSEIQSGQLGEDAAEGLEVAMQCLESAYSIEGITPPHGTDLLNIYQENCSPAPQTNKGPSEEEKRLAEEEKLRGNGLMKEANYSGAVDCYTKAIKLDSRNAIYYCNRGAAYTKLEKHTQAVDDCKEAIRIDPSYGKAYGRMGLAHLANKEYQKSIDSYEHALTLEPENASYKTNLNLAKDQLKSQQPSQPTQSNPLAGLDINSLLSNPAVMNMAQNFMTNPAMQNMFSSMMGGMGGGMPGMPGMPGAGSLPEENEETLTNDRQPTEGPAPPEGDPVAGMPGGFPGNFQMPAGLDFGNLMNASQQVAAQLREQNPELADSLREQFQQGQDQDPKNPPPSDENNQK